MLKNKCCLYVIISIRFFSITICNLLIEFPSYIRINGLITPGQSEFKWHGETVNHCDIYPDCLQLWRRLQDQNPHFIGGMPLIFIRIETINEPGAICYCEDTQLFMQYLNIEYLHKQDTFRFTHTFVSFHVLPITQKFCEELMTWCHRNISICTVSLAGIIHYSPYNLMIRYSL